MRIVVAMVVLAFCGGAAADRTGSPAERWARTDLNLEVSKTFISNEKCDASIRYLESCVAAVKAANAHLKEPVSLLENAVNFEKTLSEIASRLPAEVPVQWMLGDAINAHLETFDAHAYLAPGDSFEARDKYTGLGLFVRKLARGFLVTEVVEGSAAAAAKMNFGDLLTGLPGLKTEEFAALSVNELAQMLRGLPGTPATLEFERDGIPSKLTLTRAAVNAKNVSGSTLKFDPTMGVIRIREFVAGVTCNLFKKTLDGLQQSGVKKLIVDLRGNGGGSSQDALCIASEFVGFEEIVGFEPVEIAIPEKDLIPVFGHSEETRWVRGTTFVARQIPLALLVDANTGSAAEVLAGSLQAYKRAWLIGERTWGKGTQQTFAQLEGHPSLLLAATTDRILLPNLMSHQRVGLTPSFFVDVTLAPLALKDLEAESEATVFPSGLDALNEEWPDPRVEQRAVIGACIAKDQIDKKILGQLGPMSGDYQKAYAAAVLKCDRP